MESKPGLFNGNKLVFPRENRLNPAKKKIRASVKRWEADRQQKLFRGRIMSMRDWPNEARVALRTEKSESTQGCGDCTNAAWGSDERASEKQRFHVIACAVGVNLPGGEPLHYCPFRNVQGSLKTSQEAAATNNSKGQLRQVLTR